MGVFFPYFRVKSQKVTSSARQNVRFPVKSPVANFALTIITFIVALLALEGAVRLAGLAPEQKLVVDTASRLQSILQPDPLREVAFRPDATARVASPQGEFDVEFQTNALGLRDAPLSGAGADEFRVLVLGNSFVEGWGVEAQQTFLRVAEQQLRRQLGGRKIRLVNGGQSGYGAAQSYLTAQVLQQQVRPDLIVLVLTGTMAYSDREFLSKARLDANGIAAGLTDPSAFASIAPRKPEPRRAGFVAGLGNYSALVRLVEQRFTNRAAINAIEAGDPRSDLFAAYRAEQSRVGDIYEPTLRHVGALADFAEANGARFLLVHLPMPFQVSDEEWSEGRQAYRLGEGSFAAEEAVVKAFCAEQDYPCAFSTGTLKAAAASSAAGQPLYYRYDFHLNARGHRVFGDWLAEQLRPMIGG